jgi:hypothetical protein
VLFFQSAGGDISPHNPRDDHLSVGATGCAAVGKAIGGAVVSLLLPNPQTLPLQKPVATRAGASGPDSPATIDVEIVQHKGDKLGFTVREIAKGPNGKRAVVFSNLTPGELADQTGQIRAGQALMKVNGMAVKDLGPKDTKKAVKSMIKAGRPDGQPLTLTVTVGIIDETVAPAAVDKSGTDDHTDDVEESALGLVICSKTVNLLRRRPSMTLQKWAEKYTPIQSARKSVVHSTYGTDRFNSGATSLEILFKSAWWANVHASEVNAVVARAKESTTVSVSVVVVAQGLEWAVVSVPCDLFSLLEEAIQQKSPFKHTMINTLANGYIGYAVVLS